MEEIIAIAFLIIVCSIPILVLFFHEAGWGKSWNGPPMQVEFYYYSDIGDWTQWDTAMPTGRWKIEKDVFYLEVRSRDVFLPKTYWVHEINIPENWIDRIQRHNNEQ